MASYIVVRSDEYLAHHGIKGQKWGLRRYQNADGSLTAEGRKHYGAAEGGSRSMSREFNRDMKRLNKLQKRQDVNVQAANAAKYSKRAKIAGAGALGLAGAAVGSHFGTAAENARESQAWKVTHDMHDKAQSEALDMMFEGLKLPGGQDAATYNHLKNVFEREGYAADKAFRNYWDLKKQSSFNTAKVSTRTKILAGGAAVAGGYAAYSAIRSKIAKNRLTDEGHKKAVAKYKEQYDSMIKKYGSTPYSELIKKSA